MTRGADSRANGRRHRYPDLYGATALAARVTAAPGSMQQRSWWAHRLRVGFCRRGACGGWRRFGGPVLIGGLWRRDGRRLGRLPVVRQGRQHGFDARQRGRAAIQQGCGHHTDFAGAEQGVQRGAQLFRRFELVGRQGIAVAGQEVMRVRQRPVRSADESAIGGAALRRSVGGVFGDFVQLRDENRHVVAQDFAEQMFEITIKAAQRVRCDADEFREMGDAELEGRPVHEKVGAGGFDILHLRPFPFGGNVFDEVCDAGAEEAGGCGCHATMIGTLREHVKWFGEPNGVLVRRRVAVGCGGPAIGRAKAAQGMHSPGLSLAAGLVVRRPSGLEPGRCLSGSRPGLALWAFLLFLLLSLWCCMPAWVVTG